MKTILDMIHLGFFRNIKQTENLYVIFSLCAKKGLLKLNNEIKQFLQFLLEI
jgi:hypothetical protein